MKLRIALISTPWLPVPPKGYGGTEQIVAHLADGLVKRGHAVTLLATGDSKTRANLAFAYTKALGNNLELKLNPYNMLKHFHYFMKYIYPKGFDIIHNHAGRTGLYFMDLVQIPFLHTIHGNYTTKGNTGAHILKFGETTIFNQFKHHPFISISNHQQNDIPGLNYMATVYNGIDIAELGFHPTSSDHLIHLGRLTAVKGTDLAIRAAIKTNKPLDLYGIVDTGDVDYFAKKITPFLAHPRITLHSEVKGSAEKSLRFGNAKAFLFPLQWDEAFGLTIIESMAAGTPVIAFARGSVPEIVLDGITGFIVNPSGKDIRGDFTVKKTGMSGIYEAIERIYALSRHDYQIMRKQCRAHVEKHFTIDVMVDNYVKSYEKILAGTYFR